ncbi:MAG: 4-hydroxyphenylacetate catabolism regulatory protein HpaA [Neisseriaceae bacterium]|nr:4-hydroxyphenylacetate catabolism regulatory protein HpaA [Neisseriaceae bacterium]MBP6863601.1 4-hydroxyphenylacetate catabolism regulatory protein HpaA [Neisseriaceae bacterium]
MKPKHIPNLNLVQTYDKFYKDAHVHYESLDNLASFFGRAMHLHRHDRYYQLHYIHSGKVHLILGEDEYNEQAPLLFLTPPPVPHGFVTEPHASGQVLTVHQSVVQQLIQGLDKRGPNIDAQPFCFTLRDLSEAAKCHEAQLIKAFNGLDQEVQNHDALGQSAAINHWAQLVLVNLFRLIAGSTQMRPSHHSQSAIFRKFLGLIEEYYKDHLVITQYAQLLNVTEGRLNKICRTIANASSKQLIFERLVQEAKYLLSYTNLSIKEIAFDLGFQDPAYFTRFFIKYTTQTPKDYRNHRV